MAAEGKIEVDVEISIPADKLWTSIGESTTLFPKAVPHRFKSIEVLEGDGKSVGSVRLINYADGAPMVTFSKEKIDSLNEGNKTVSYHVIEGDILKYYKNFKASLSVTPKGDGSLVKWWCEFEKTSADIPEPNLIRDVAVMTFKDLETYLKA